ncbi:MAG TPA: serine hydrolase [Gemmatimonadaceae bacterium]|nr:serine hydrolase [Gemmatimonadaceae bacterium]
MLQIVPTVCMALSMACPSPPGPAHAEAAVAASYVAAARLASIDHVAELGLEAPGYAGMAVVVGRRDTVLWQRGYGGLTWGEDASRVSADRTIYDLASLTKVVATTAAVMVLYDRGKLHLDDRASKYLPELRQGSRRSITIRQLLEHRSGFPAGRELSRARTPREARQLVLATPLAYTPGARQIYSDIGADVLGFVVEAIAHEPLDAFVRRNVFAPLGMKSTMFSPGASLRSRIAPTERLSARGYPLRGEVHDPAAYAMGGVAGHAGLFGTASDLAVFARMLLGGGSYGGVRIFGDSTVALFTRRSAGTRALGWETCAGGASCGQHMGERAFGHTGFTGTSIWIDPERDLFVIVLSNRIHELPGGRVPPGAVLADVRADIADIAELALPLGGVLPEMPERLRADRAIGWPVRSTASVVSSEAGRTDREPF